MAKKLSLLLASIAVVAFAAPAFASAAPAVTDPPGVLLPPGALIQGTNIGAVVTETSLGKISCETVDITGELTHNTGSTVRGIGAGAASATVCNVGGKPVTITDITLVELHSSAVGKGTINVTFKADLPNNVTCHFSSANMPFTYTAGTDIIKVKEGDLLGTPAACEPGKLTGEFTIETDTEGEPEPKKDPILLD